jgi:hypothetical protein
VDIEYVLSESFIVPLAVQTVNCAETELSLFFNVAVCDSEGRTSGVQTNMVDPFNPYCHNGLTIIY